MSKESHLQLLERHAREGEERIKRQKQIIRDLEKDGHDNALPAARQLLENLEDSHRATLDLLQIERSSLQGRK
jgi:hypothetical protein